MSISKVDDPFESARKEKGTLRCPFEGESIPMILRHAEVRKAAKNFTDFSSDAPMRVVIPSEENVRSVRQLPIETDPPLHGEYRKLVEPLFRRPRTPEVEAEVAQLVREAVDQALLQDSVEVVRKFALPLQSRALTRLLNLPMTEAERWIAWGVHVFRDPGADGAGRGAELNAYIEQQIDRALTEPGEDFFSVLTQAEFRGRRLSREEIAGFANLAFAGGRDTIITIVSSAIAWLAEHPEGLGQLANDPKLALCATEEFVRYYTPLTLIGRVSVHGKDLHGERVESGERIGLCWASANRDETVFKNPEEVQLDRRPNPHVGFGFGAHNCLGAVQARLILRTLLSELGEKVGSMEIVEAEPHWEENEKFRRQVGFAKLVVRFQAR